MELRGVNAVVLAGGLGRRFREKGGGEKLFAPVGGKPMLLRLVENLSPAFPKIIVATKGDKIGEIEKLLGGFGNVEVIDDGFEHRSPIFGMIAGAREAESPLVFVASGDSPFITPSLPSALLELGRGCEAVVPIWPSGAAEPLISLYSRELLLRSSQVLGLKPVRGDEAARASRTLALVPVSLLEERGVDARQLLSINEPSDIPALERKALEVRRRKEDLVIIEEKERPYWEAVEKIKAGKMLEASLKFAEEAVLLSRARPNLLSLHALQDSLTFFSRSITLNPSGREHRKTSRRP